MRTLIPVQTLYASFGEVALADRAAAALLDCGVKARDISLVARDSEASQGREKHMEYTASTRAARGGLTATTPRDAAIGAAKGAGIGIGLGAVAAVTSILIPGVGLVTGGGALAAAIAGAAGAAAAGAAAGGVTGYLKDQGVPETAISQYSEDYEGGGAILGVTVPSNGVDEETARSILAKYHGNYVCAFGGYGES